MCLALLLSPQRAHSEVTRSGDWPGEEPRVSLDLSGVPRAAALRELAEQNLAGHNDPGAEAVARLFEQLAQAE